MVNDPDYAIIQVLSDHEHIIDCIMWAPPEACKTIENAGYNSGLSGAVDEQDENADGDGGGEQDLQTNASSAAAAADNGDDTRATINTRMTTKERI